MKFRTKMQAIIARALTSVAFVAALAMPASADKLDDILAAGKVTIGVLLSAPPNGYLDDAGNPAGFDPEIATKVAQHMGVEVELVPLVNNARIPALQAGQVDFLIASLIPTPERAKVMMFTIPYAAVQTVVIARKSDSYESFEDLVGKRLGVIRGSPSDTMLTGQGIEGLEILRYEDASVTMQALISGQADAVVNDLSVVANLLSQRPDMDLKTQFVVNTSGFSMAVMPGEFALLQWLNTTLDFMKKNGDLDEIMLKWVGGPMPDLPSF